MFDQTYIASDGSLWYLRNDCPPIPIRVCDWIGWPSDADENGPTHWGETVADVVASIESEIRDSD